MLEQIKAYIEKYPDEVVFIDITQEYGRDLRDKHKEWIYRRCIQAFGSRLVTQSDKDNWCDIDTVTLIQMREHNKSVWLLVED